jgi:DNA-binding response OmpR family regulator
MKREKIHITVIEDEPVSAGLTLRMLREAGLDQAVTQCGTLAEGLKKIEETRADIALLDMGLPDSHGTPTVSAVCGRYPMLPVVVMTGTDDEAMGLEELQQGAQDYLVKGQFGHRELARTIRYALERKDLLNEKETLIAQLQEALLRVKQLSGLLPICADCKKIRTSQGGWMQLETYISEHSDASFTHGFCEACYKKRLKEIG